MAKLADHRKPYAQIKTAHRQIMRDFGTGWHRSTFPNMTKPAGMKKGPEGPFVDGSGA
jgi:hypothetical protein